jgi:hypothetical protein
MLEDHVLDSRLYAMKIMIYIEYWHKGRLYAIMIVIYIEYWHEYHRVEEMNII